MNDKLKIFDFLFLLQRGDFKGADPLNLLKIFDPTFYKKLVGCRGETPDLLNVCNLTFWRNYRYEKI